MFQFLIMWTVSGESEREKERDVKASTLNCSEVVFKVGIKSQVIKLVIFFFCLVHRNAPFQYYVYILLVTNDMSLLIKQRL